MAIKVGGSPVITDGYQLANITSLDSTTTSTIGAAAGGATKLIHDNIALPSASPFPTSIDFDLTDGYRYYKIAMSGLRFDSSNYSGSIQFQLKNASNTLVTTGYWGMAIGLLDTSYSTALRTNWYQHAANIPNELVYRRSNFYGEYDFVMEIYNANLTDQRTLIKWSWGGDFNAPNLSETHIGHAFQRTKEAHNYLHMFAPFSGTNASLRDGRYSMWGVDL